MYANNLPSLKVYFMMIPMLYEMRNPDYHAFNSSLDG